MNATQSTQATTPATANVWAVLRAAARAKVLAEYRLEKNGEGAIALARRGLALARDYAAKRIAFGAPLSEKPLHVDTLAGLDAEFMGALHLTFDPAKRTGKMNMNGVLTFVGHRFGWSYVLGLMQQLRAVSPLEQARAQGI